MTVTPELSRLVPLDRLGSRPLEIEVVADEVEARAVALRLGIPAVTALRCRFTLLRRSDDVSVINAQAELTARVVQVCVIDLEPFEAPVSERFELRFVPAGQESLDDDPESPDEIAYDLSTLDLGEVSVEQLALALDPFPRRPGAVMQDPVDEPTASPFAALIARRRADEV